MFNVFNRTNLAQPLNNLGYGSCFGWSTSTIGVSYGAPGIGSGEPYNTQLRPEDYLLSTSTDILEEPASQGG